MSNCFYQPNEEKAYILEQRWLACSERARHFAAHYAGRFQPLLPHVIAEQYDMGLIDERHVPRTNRPTDQQLRGIPRTKNSPNPLTIK